MNQNDLRRRIAAAALAAAVLAAAPVLPGCAASGSRPSSAHPKDMTFAEPEFTFPHSERVVLSNGMVLHLIEDHSLPLVDASAVIRGGSVFDPPGKEGLAAIACNMIRAGGTKKLDPAALDAELDRIAGAVGVGAGEESLGASFSFLSKDLDAGIDLFADVLRNPGFHAGRFGQMKNASAMGIQRQLQSPGGVLGRTFASTVHGGHPYGNLVTAKSIGGITREDLDAFHGKWFRPDSFVLGIAGDFQRDALVAKLEKAFAGWERSPEPLPKWPAPFERKYEGGHFVVPMPKVTQTNVRMGHWGPPQNLEDRVKFDVMNLVLGGGGFWSRMTKVVRTREGLAYSVGCGLRRASQGGVFQASVETKASTSYRAITLMKQLMEEIREEPITAEDLALAKESILNGFVQVIESPASLARQYADLEHKEYPANWLDRYREIVRATTVEDVQAMAREYLRPDGLKVVLVGDPSLFDEAPADLGPATVLTPR
jgi:zinc protease